EHLLSEHHLQNILSLKECIANPDVALARGILEPPDHGDTITSFLAKHTPSFPSWLKVMATVRTQLLELTKQLPYTRISLDNVQSENIQKDILQYVSFRPDHGDTITSFLAKHTPSFPSWLKVMATVRTQLLELTKQLPYTRISLDNVQSENIQKDILQYVSFRFRLKDPTRNGIWLKNMHLADWFPTKNRLLKAFYKVTKRPHPRSRQLITPTASTSRKNDPPQEDPDTPRKKHPRRQLFAERVKSQEKSREIKVLNQRVTKRPHPRSRQLITPTASTSRKNDPPQEDPDTPRKKHPRRQLFAERVKSQEKSREIKVLNQRVRRLKRHIVSLKQVVKESLKTK
ncbi:unnamed protein product, partial [Acanthoscelides obtectus]